MIPDKSSGEITHNFIPGDVVEVCEGELIHLQGKVVSIEGNKIFMIPKHEGLKDVLDFPAHELKKHFKTGDHVKVIGGKYEGDTGLIVRVEDNTVVLFSDLTMHEVCSSQSVKQIYFKLSVFRMYIMYITKQVSTVNYKLYVITFFILLRKSMLKVRCYVHDRVNYISCFFRFIYSERWIKERKTGFIQV